MPEDRDELISHYRETREALLAAIEGLPDAVLEEQSLDGWSLTDHLMHIAFWDEIRATEVMRISAGHASLWQMDGAQDEALNTLVHALRRRVSAEQAKWELAESRERLLEAIASATPRGMDSSLYGEAGLRSGHEAQHTGWIKRWRREKEL